MCNIYSLTHQPESFNQCQYRPPIPLPTSIANPAIVSFHLREPVNVARANINSHRRNRFAVYCGYVGNATPHANPSPVRSFPPPLITIWDRYYETKSPGDCCRIRHGVHHDEKPESDGHIHRWCRLLQKTCKTADSPSNPIL